MTPPTHGPDHQKILIVDDDEDLAHTVAQIVVDVVPASPVSIAVAASGAEALRLMASERFDLVVTDYNLGGMDGIQVMLHARRVRPGVACILMSGDPDARFALLSSPLANDVAFLRKPFAGHDLIRLAAAALATSSPPVPGQGARAADATPS